MSNIDRMREQYGTGKQVSQGYKAHDLSDRIWMKAMPQEVIIGDAWRGFGKLYNGKVDSGYTAIVIQPGKDVQQRSIETKEIFQ
jgi:hypothetical protein